MNTNNLLVSGVSQQLVLCIKEKTKFLKLVVDKRRNACKEKWTKWSGLPNSMQNLTPMTSSVNSYQIPNKATVLFHKFYTNKEDTKDQAFLNKMIAAASCIASVDSGCVLAFFSGFFVSDVADLSANFSIFLVPVAQPNAASSQDAAKQWIQAPNLADDLVYQIANNIKLSLFFFSDDSVLTAKQHGFYQSIRKHIIMFRAAQLRLRSFAVKFAYAVNTQTFRCLKMCRNAEDCSQVNNTLANFDTLL